MIDEDRPLKPDKQYLEQAEEQYKKKIKQDKDYLKKHEEEKLACFRHRQKQVNHKKQKIPNKSKATLYEQIKKKNRQKFGQWERKHVVQPKQQKKIDPKKMTVSYKHKQIKIKTEQYKKPGYIPPPKQEIQQDPEKLEYHKMLDFLKNCYEDFEKQKQEFQGKKEYLKFKNAAAKEEPLNIQISSKIDNKNHHYPEKRNKVSTTKQNKNMNQQQISGNAEKVEEEKLYRYSIENIHECAPFELKQLCKFTPVSQFYFQNNLLYQQAQDILENCRDQAITQLKGEKRFTKFTAGWYEAWLPGKHRTAYNEHKNYKVTWYGNGDVRQQFGSNTITYFKKKNRVQETRVQNHNRILFFPDKDQLQMHNEKGREIRFSDGHFQQKY